MQRLALLILITGLLAQTFSRFAIQLDYLANTAAYIKNCENKSKPKLHCNGKCQVMKKMKEEEKKERQRDSKWQLDEQALSSKSFFYTVDIVSTSVNKVFPFAKGDLSGRPFSCFHPPQYGSSYIS